MPIITRWYIPNRVVLAHVLGDITQEDMKQHIAELTAMLDSGQRPVHWINDIRYMTRSYFDLRTARESLDYMRHPAIGWAVNYGQRQNPMIRFTNAIISQFFRLRVREMNTWQEALTFLKEIDASVDWSLGDPALFEDLQGFQPVMVNANAE